MLRVDVVNTAIEKLQACGFNWGAVPQPESVLGHIGD